MFGSPYFDFDGLSDHFHYRFAQGFNFATTPFYRVHFEPEGGRRDWETRDRLLDWLEGKGIKAKGHPLSWYNRSGLTDWMQRLNYGTLKEVVYHPVLGRAAPSEAGLELGGESSDARAAGAHPRV